MKAKKLVVGILLGAMLVAVPLFAGGNGKGFMGGVTMLTLFREADNYCKMVLEMVLCRDLWMVQVLVQLTMTGKEMGKC